MVGTLSSKCSELFKNYVNYHIDLRPCSFNIKLVFWKNKQSLKDSYKHSKYWCRKLKNLPNDWNSLKSPPAYLIWYLVFPFPSCPVPPNFSYIGWRGFNNITELPLLGGLQFFFMTRPAKNKRWSVYTLL